MKILLKRNTEMFKNVIKVLKRFQDKNEIIYEVFLEPVDKTIKPNPILSSLLSENIVKEFNVLLP